MQINRIIGSSIIACAVGVSFFLSGCADGPPGCDAPEVKEAVFQIVYENPERSGWYTYLPLRETFQLEAIRMRGQDKETRAYSCAATIRYTGVDPKDEIQRLGFERDITYTIENTSGDEEFYVTVFGLRDYRG